MRKSILSILLFCLLSSTIKIQAQCTPDTSFNTSGTRPSALDTAKVGILYSQVIQFHITKDTLVWVPQLGQTLNARIDTLWITNVKGMPAGFSYSCHNAQCKIIGGTTGCATLSGTPAPMSGGIYPLLVIITIRATAFLGRIPVAQTVVDTNAGYAIVVQSPAGNVEFTQNSQPIVYPNPAKEDLQIFIPNMKGSFHYTLTNLKGQSIEEGIMPESKLVNHLQLPNLQRGIYLLHLNGGQQNWVKKILIE